MRVDPPAPGPIRPADPPGQVALHASAVARDGAGVLLLGPPGAGKSTLAIALIESGLTLVGDDRILLDGDLAAPAPGLEGLVELRGFGIVRLGAWRPARIVLALDLGTAEARLPEAGARGPGAIALRLGFDPRAPAAVARIRLMLDCLDPGGAARLVAGAAAAPSGAARRGG